MSPELDFYLNSEFSLVYFAIPNSDTGSVRWRFLGISYESTCKQDPTATTAST